MLHIVILNQQIRRRNMDKNFESEVIERLVKIETKLDDYNNVKSKTEEASSKANSNEKRIDVLEDKIKWIGRIAAGAIITGAIGLIFIVIQNGLGLK